MSPNQATPLKLSIEKDFKNLDRRRLNFSKGERAIIFIMLMSAVFSFAIGWYLYQVIHG